MNRIYMDRFIYTIGPIGLKWEEPRSDPRPSLPEQFYYPTATTAAGPSIANIAYMISSQNQPLKELIDSAVLV